ncbi:hypothetical protein B0T36_01165 [Nocardia donostiensis]|uniref:hypothetical protein n=1 Tax=Nocardia donostiensis TaxID=1538463 RepID=UPI0009DAD00A|nr:hypothetical protein [Nocardia donostiensis]OQS17243.1 hypothetical protein B0T36_01165 [Nocardia donostiensis]
MGKDLDFKGEHAERVAGEVDALSERIQAVLATISGAETALWGCWGTDKTGQTFAEDDSKNGYIASSKGLQENIESYPEFLSGDKGYAPEFRAAAKVLNATEQGNKAEIERPGRARR